MSYEETDENKANVHFVGSKIMFYDYLGERSTAEMVYLLNELEADHYQLPVTVRINSYGGYTTDGLAIYNIIQELNGEFQINTHIDSACYSAATLIFLAGKKRSMYKSSTMLIHQIRTQCSEASEYKYRDIIDEQESMKILMDLYADIYVKHSNMSKKQVQELMQKEKLLTAKECLKLGLCDHII